MMMGADLASAARGIKNVCIFTPTQPRLPDWQVGRYTLFIKETHRASKAKSTHHGRMAASHCSAQRYVEQARQEHPPWQNGGIKHLMVVGAGQQPRRVWLPAKVAENGSKQPDTVCCQCALWSTSKSCRKLKILKLNV